MAALAPRDQPSVHWKNIRYHQADGNISWAVYSECGAYRYRLRRVWGAGARRVGYLMLNPSTASELGNDPTVERCERRARAMGFDGFEVVNIFALRSTDPKGLYGARDPVGVDNDRAIAEAMTAVDQMICAWGNHGQLGNRAAAVRVLLGVAQGVAQGVAHLGLTKIGEPKHPLYLPYSTTPQPWQL